MTLLRCDINYYYGAFFSFFEKKNENFYDAFLECEKMALVGYDTNYYYFTKMILIIIRGPYFLGA